MASAAQQPTEGQNIVDTDWADAVKQISDRVVQIRTPQVSGTGFLLYHSDSVRVVATAAHVVDHVHEWDEPLRLRHPSSDAKVFLTAAERAVFVDNSHDIATIYFTKDGIDFPTDPAPLLSDSKVVDVGREIGWVGFPAVSPGDLCFFSGRVSCAATPQTGRYLVDGVAIHGVSGGPAFLPALSEEQPVSYEPQIVGVVSAYIPNTATGESLPGLALVRDVTQLRDEVQKYQSLKDARVAAEMTWLPIGPPPRRP